MANKNAASEKVVTKYDRKYAEKKRRRKKRS